MPIIVPRLSTSLARSLAIAATDLRQARRDLRATVVITTVVVAAGIAGAALLA